jgi:hypothetical protein
VSTHMSHTKSRLRNTNITPKHLLISINNHNNIEVA